MLINQGAARGEIGDDFAFFGHFAFVFVGIGKHHRLSGHEAVTQSPVLAGKAQHFGVQHGFAQHHHQAMHRAHEGVGRAAPTHHFGNRQFLHCLRQHIGHHAFQALAALGVFIGIHVLFAIVDDFQIRHFSACAAGKTQQGFGRLAIFHAIGHRWAFFHHLLVGLHRYHVFHQHAQAAR